MDDSKNIPRLSSKSIFFTSFQWDSINERRNLPIFASSYSRGANLNVIWRDKN